MNIMPSKCIHTLKVDETSQKAFFSKMKLLCKHIYTLCLCHYNFRLFSLGAV